MRPTSLALLVVLGPACTRDLARVVDLGSRPPIALTDVSPAAAVRGIGCFTVEGTLLDRVTRARIGGREALSFEALSPTALQICPAADTPLGTVTIEAGDNLTLAQLATPVSVVESALALAPLGNDTRVAPGDTFTIRGHGFDMGDLSNHTVTFAGGDTGVPAIVLSVFADRMLVEVPQGAVSGSVEVALRSLDPAPQTEQTDPLTVLKAFSITAIEARRPEGAFSGEEVTVYLDATLPEVARGLPTVTLDGASVEITTADPLTEPLKVRIPDRVFAGTRTLCVRGEIPPTACSTVQALGWGHTDLIRPPLCRTRSTFPLAASTPLAYDAAEINGQGRAPELAFAANDTDDAVYVFDTGSGDFRGAYPLVRGGRYTELVAATACRAGRCSESPSPETGFVAAYDELADRVVVAPMQSATLSFSLDLAGTLNRMHVIDGTGLALFVDREDTTYVSVVDIDDPPAAPLSGQSLDGRLMAITPIDPQPEASNAVSENALWLAGVQGSTGGRWVVLDFGTGTTATLLPAGTPPGTAAFNFTFLELGWVPGTDLATFYDSDAGRSGLMHVNPSDGTIIATMRLRYEDGCAPSVCGSDPPPPQSLPAVGPHDGVGQWVYGWSHQAFTTAKLYTAYLTGDLTTFVDTTPTHYMLIDDTGSNHAIDADSGRIWLGSGAEEGTIVLAGSTLRSYMEADPSMSLRVQLLATDRTGWHRASQRFDGVSVYGFDDDGSYIQVSAGDMQQVMERQMDPITFQLRHHAGANLFGLDVPPALRKGGSVTPQMLISTDGLTSFGFDWLEAGGSYPGETGTTWLTSRVEQTLRVSHLSASGTATAPFDVTLTEVSSCYQAATSTPAPATLTDLLGSDEAFVGARCHEDAAVQSCSFDDPSDPTYVHPDHPRGGSCTADSCRAGAEIHLWRPALATPSTAEPIATGICGHYATAQDVLPGPSDDQKLLSFYTMHDPPGDNCYSPCQGCYTCVIGTAIPMASLLNISDTTVTNLTPSLESAGRTAVRLVDKDGDGLIGLNRSWYDDGSRWVSNAREQLHWDSLGRRWLFLRLIAEKTRAELCSLSADDMTVQVHEHLTQPALGMVLSPDDRRVYVLMEGGQEIRVYDNSADVDYLGATLLPVPAGSFAASEDGQTLLAAVEGGYCTLTD